MLKGHQLLLVKVFIANYCTSLIEQNCVTKTKISVEKYISDIVSKANDKYKLVPDDKTKELINDISIFYHCLTDQKITEIDQNSYWEWKETLKK